MNRKYLSDGQKLVAGIYGGMGPMAHIKFENHLVSACKELGITGDQSIPVWLTVSGSSTPDRTKSIQGVGNHALSHMNYFSKILKLMGADFIVAICNTAHYYLPYVGDNIDVPIVSMIDQTVVEILTKHIAVKKVGLLATSGTLQTGLYQKALNKFDVKVVTFPINSVAQKQVMNSIYAKKYGIKQTGDLVHIKAKDILTKSAQDLINNGAEVIIAGCTEISLAIEDQNSFTIIDPLKVLAHKVVNLSLGFDKLNSSEKLSRFSFQPPD